MKIKKNCETGNFCTEAKMEDCRGNRREQKEEIQVSQEEQSHTAKRKGKYHRLCIGVLHFSPCNIFHSFLLLILLEDLFWMLKVMLDQNKSIKKMKLAGFLCYEA